MQWVVVLTLLFSDIVLAALIWTPAYSLQSLNVFGRGTFSSVAAFSVIPNVAVWIGLCALLSLYPGYGLTRAEKLRRQTYAVVATVAITATFAVFFQIGDLLSRLVLLSGFLGLLLLAPLNRYFAEWAMMKIGLWGKLVVVLGPAEKTARLIRMLRQEWALGFRPVAFFDDEGPPREEKLEGVPYGGTLSDAINSGALNQGVDTAIFAVPPSRSEHLDRVVNQLTARLRYMILVPEIAEVTTSAVVARDLAGTFGIEAKQNLLNPWARRAKRTFDLFGVVIGGLLISPLLLAIAVLIKLDSPGPVFYKQRRPGRGGEYFSCWKFRTMYRDAELVLTRLLQSDPDLLAEWERERKLRDDPRVTRVGRFLRKTSLDELPQLWNVLRGEMSLVGPRPMLPEEIPEYGKVYKLYKRMRPGITGLWQVSGRSDTSYEERVTMVAYYVCNWSIWLDLVILARTIRSVIFGHGAV